MYVLGIETSCDETAVAVVKDDKTILSNKIYSQLLEHKNFGGVVPEIAARAHLKKTSVLIQEALDESNIQPAHLAAIAVTSGPGLIGGLMVGLTMAKTLSMVWKCPLVEINHLEGHALSAHLSEAVCDPFLLLLVSGGHTQIIKVMGVDQYTMLGTTVDDAAGECFDKVSKMLDLGYPGGPLLEKLASRGCPDAFQLPRPMVGKKHCDFSFSGLKTAVQNIVIKLKNDDLWDDQTRANVAASFQHTVAKILEDRCHKAFEMVVEELPIRHLVVAGGVAANQHIRQHLIQVANVRGAQALFPTPGLCTDNAAMIAWAGIQKIKIGHKSDLNVAPKPRWPLDQMSFRSNVITGRK